MNSLTKRWLTHEELASIVTKAFGSISLLTYDELKEGFYSSAYALSLSDGRRAVLKVAPPDNVTRMRHEKDIMRVEVEVMRMLKQQTDLPFPAIYLYDRSLDIIDSDYFLMEHLNGQPYHKLKDQFTEEQQAAIEHQLGTLNRRINALKGPAFGSIIFPEKQSTSWHSAFMMMAEDALQDCADAAVELPAPIETLRQYFVDGREAMAEVQTPSLVHWDLWNGNVFVDEQTGSISGLIDCERAFWGDPLMEYYFRPFESSPAFLQGYGLHPQTTAERERMLRYDLYLYLILHVEGVFRGYNNPEHQQRALENLQQFWSQISQQT